MSCEERISVVEREKERERETAARVFLKWKDANGTEKILKV